MTDSQPKDWTTGPAKWAAVVFLGALGAAGIVWSVINPNDVSAAPRQGPAARANHATPTDNRQRELAQADVQRRVTPTDARRDITPALSAPAVFGPPMSLDETDADSDAVESSPQPTHEPDDLPRLVNLNTASAAELELLPGIGPTLAERIVAHRAANGPFKTLDDLDRVPGIGPRTLERLRGLVSVK